MNLEINDVPHPLAIGVAELARLISLSPITVRQYIREGKIHSLKFGRRRLILYSEVMRLLRRAERESYRRESSF